MATVRSPTMPRRRLGIELRDVREAAGKTIEDAAEVLDCSNSTVSRIENGQVGVSLRDVRDLLDHYRVQGERRAEIMELARTAREKAWRQEYGDTPAVAVMGLQVAATGIDTYQAQLVPGLLQTGDYAQAVMLALDPTLDQERVRRSLEIRRARQGRLFGDAPATLVAVLDEAVIRRQVGGPLVIREQLRHLVNVMELPNVTVQVSPFDAGEHGGLLGSFMIFRLPDERDPDVVLLEQRAKDLYLERPGELRRYGAAFGRLRGKALDHDRSLALIEDLAGGSAVG